MNDPNKGMRNWLRFLEWFCPPSLYESIEGDLLEQFEKDLSLAGRKRAQVKLALDTIRFFRPGIILRNRFSLELNSFYMLKSYFIVAYRQLVKNRIFSIINIVGMAVGMASVFLIALYLNFELDFDKIHENRDQIYRIANKQYEKGELRNSSAGTFWGVTGLLKENFPEVEHSVHINKWPANTGAILQAGNMIFNERNYLFAEPDFFQVFPSLLKHGDRGTCFRTPNSVVLSDRLSKKMFGASDPMGKTITHLGGRGELLTVTGIMIDPPENAHFSADILVPFENSYSPEKEYFWKGTWWTYITVAKGTDIEKLQSRLNRAVHQAQEGNPEVKDVQLILQSINDIHFYSNLKREIKPNGDISLVYTLAITAIVLLLVVWINYINLETSRFIIRIKEVGVRRIIGSSKRELMMQFFVQYALINFLAFAVALGIVYSVMPYYQFLTGVPIVSVYNGISSFWMIPGIAFLVGSCITGIYPSLLLLKFNPIASLKGKVTNVQGTILRKSLLTFQFAVSIVLVAILFVVNEQLNFMRQTNKSINLSQVLTVYNPTNYSVYEDSLRQEKNEIFRNKLLQSHVIANLTTSSAIPGEPIGFTYKDLAKRSLNDPDKEIPYKVMYIDYDFIPLFGLKLLAGRNYTRGSGEDTNDLSLVVTESTIHELGFASVGDAIDREIYFMEDKWEKWKIIGIVGDYRHESVKSPIYPTIFRLHRNRGQMVYYSMQLNEGTRLDESISFAEKTWKEVWPEKPFNYFLMDKYYDEQYKSEIHFKRIFSLFSGIAIFIACLGILGMTLFEVNSRLKEISIRKVLGASVSNLVKLLSTSYFKVSLTAFAIATPVIYLSTLHWLSAYPVRIEVGASVFALPLVTVLVIVIVGSGFQTIKAANTNPVDNLKNE